MKFTPAVRVNSFWKLTVVTWIVLSVTHCGFMYSSAHSNLSWLMLNRSLLKNERAFLKENNCSKLVLPSGFRTTDAAVGAHLVGCYQVAKELFDRTEELPPNDVVVQFFAGNTYYECDNIEQAMMHWRNAKAFSHFFSKCQESLRQNRYDDVLTQCEIAVELDPSCALAFDYLGRGHAFQHQDQLAVQFYEKALMLDNSIPGLYIRAGSAYERLGQLEIAQRYFLLAVEQTPVNARGYYLLGRVHLKQGNYVEAETFLRKAIQLDDQQAGYFLMLADTYCVMHDAQKAETYYRLAQNLAPTDSIIANKIRTVRECDDQLE